MFSELHSWWNVKEESKVFFPLSSFKLKKKKKESACNAGDPIGFLGQEDSLEKK